MFGLNLNPWLTLGAFVVGMSVGGAASVATYEKLIMPGREAALEERVTKSVTLTQQIICRDTTNLAATAAQEAARLRQKQAGEAAFEAYLEATNVRAAARVTEIERLEQENANYARKLEAEGRSCPLDAGTAEWLRATPTNPDG